jgi:hypothetical protein
MDNKLSELSKPVAWVTMQREFCDDERSVITNEVAAEKYSLDCYDLTPVYSQEYVSALLARIAEFEAEEARRKLIRDTWNNIPAWKPLKHSGRGA